MAMMTQADRERYGTAEVRRLVRGRSYEEVVAIRDGMIAQSRLAAMKTIPEDEGLRQFEAVLAGAYDAVVTVVEPHALDNQTEESLVVAFSNYMAPAGSEQWPDRTYEQRIDPAGPNGPVTADELELSRLLDALIGG